MHGAHVAAVGQDGAVACIGQQGAQIGGGAGDGAVVDGLLKAGAGI